MPIEPRKHALERAEAHTKPTRNVSSYIIHIGNVSALKDLDRLLCGKIFDVGTAWVLSLRPYKYFHGNFYHLLWQAVYFRRSIHDLLRWVIYYLPWKLPPPGQLADRSSTVCVENRLGHLMGRNARRTARGQAVDSPRTAHGQSVDTPWTACGQHVDSPWAFCIKNRHAESHENKYRRIAEGDTNRT